MGGPWESVSRKIEKLISEGRLSQFKDWHPVRRTMWVPTPTGHSRLMERHLRGQEIARYVDLLPQDSNATTVIQVFHIYMLEKFMGEQIENLNSVVELGGGIGILCELFYRLAPRVDYTIYDLEPTSVIQQHYLGRQNIPARLITDWGQVGGGDLFVSCNAFNEIPLEERVRFELDLESFARIFIAYQERFAGIDNRSYFGEVRERFAGHEWVDVSTPAGAAKYRLRYLYGEVKQREQVDGDQKEDADR